MKRVTAEELLKVLSRNESDYCMLMPLIEHSEMLSRVECYMSEKENEDFLCYIVNPDNSRTLDIHYEQHDPSDLIDLLSELDERDEISDGCMVGLYKSNSLLAALSELFELGDTELYTSFIDDGRALEDAEAHCELIVGTDGIVLEDDFTLQQGNHINVIMRVSDAHPDNYQLLFLKTDNKVVGYVVLATQYGDLWDVAYIFVDENCRNRGFATRMCKSAQRYLRKNGLRMFYSFCENAASEAVARKCGLIPCAQRYIFTLQGKKDKTNAVI